MTTVSDMFACISGQSDSEQSKTASVLVSQAFALVS